MSHTSSKSLKKKIVLVFIDFMDKVQGNDVNNFMRRIKYKYDLFTLPSTVWD